MNPKVDWYFNKEKKWQEEITHGVQEWYKAHLRNLKENTGTMAFMLGLFFEGWLHAAESPEVNRRWSAERVARDFFSISRDHVTELGLDISTICQATEENCDKATALWNLWRERIQQPMLVHSRQINGGISPTNIKYVTSRHSISTPPATMAALMLAVLTVSAGFGIVLPLLPNLLQRLLGTGVTAAQISLHTGLLTSV